jgi:hypothetical protein
MVMVDDMEKDPPFEKWLRRLNADSGYTIDVFGELIDAGYVSRRMAFRREKAFGRRRLDYLSESRTSCIGSSRWRPTAQRGSNRRPRSP